MTELASYPLRLPRSVKAAAESLAKAEGVSMNQFIATAVAEKLSVLNTAQYFQKRRAGADFDLFDRLLARKESMPPRAGDERG